MLINLIALRFSRKTNPKIKKFRAFQLRIRIYLNQCKKSLGIKIDWIKLKLTSLLNQVKVIIVTQRPV